MPPYVDVYARVEQRDELVLRQFLDEYASDWGEPGTWLDDEPLGDALHRAFSDPKASFARYGRAEASALSHVIIAFGTDGSMILGLSIDGADEKGAVQEAEGLIDRLKSEVGASSAIAVWEEPPPLSRDEWDSVVGSLGGRLVSVR